MIWSEQCSIRLYMIFLSRTYIQTTIRSKRSMFVRPCPLSPFYHLKTSRFVWNSHALSSMMEQSELLPFCLPIMHGMIKIVSCFVRGRTFDLMLISRRSNKRAGTRFVFALFFLFVPKVSERCSQCFNKIYVTVMCRLFRHKNYFYGVD